MLVMRYIHNVNLRALDLNLLVAFDALVAEGSVTRAARRIGLSQPAMSNALARLRDALGDPLFVRSPRGMLATPRARELGPAIRDALAALERALPQPPFDPRTASRAFTISSLDSAELSYGAGLLARLLAEAPGVSLAFAPPARGGDPTEMFEAGRADVAIISTKHLPSTVRSAPLVDQRLVAVARRNHPRVDGKLTLPQLCGIPHVLVAPYGVPGGILDDALAKQGRRRTVALRVATFASAPAIVSRTDCIAVVPESIATVFAPALRLQVLELPVHVPPIPIALVWHPRVEHEPAHRWFRDLVCEVIRPRA
jgi:DNA-binding transcriptional LysR family regulator